MTNPDTPPLQLRELLAAAPAHVGLAGDWHGNIKWAVTAIHAICARIPRPDPYHPKVILHAGDFGIWPGDTRYLSQVAYALAEEDAVLIFVDGNHENHDRLTRLLNQQPGESFIAIRDRIWWATRGARWTWGGKTWLALGGAASVDRAGRTPGISWWPGEEITITQAAIAALAGKCDVMLTHDAPTGFHPPLTGDVPPWWDLETAHHHQYLLRKICEEVEPSWLIHGHLHLAHTSRKHTDWGDVEIIGLGCDGQPGNWGTLRLEDMKWEPGT